MRSAAEDDIAAAALWYEARCRRSWQATVVRGRFDVALQPLIPLRARTLPGGPSGVPSRPAAAPAVQACCSVPTAERVDVVVLHATPAAIRAAGRRVPCQ